MFMRGCFCAACSQVYLTDDARRANYFVNVSGGSLVTCRSKEKKVTTAAFSLVAVCPAAVVRRMPDPFPAVACSNHARSCVPAA